MNPPASPRTRLTVLATCLAAVALSIAFVDRPASTWTHAHLHGIHFFDDLTHLVDYLRAGSAIILIVAGIAACAGWRPGRAGMTVIAVCLAELVSFEIKEWLKLAFGRTWPETWTNNNPSWIGNGAFGFHPFHGKEGWYSFPSGHMTQMTAVATVLWARVRPLRCLWAALPVAVAIGLYGSDYHWVGDMLAGASLGFGCATGILALLFRGHPDPETTCLSRHGPPAA